MDKPTEGKVYISGTDIHSLSEDKLAIFRRRHIGLVYQFYNLMPVLNVDENIALPHLLDGRALDRERLDQVVEHLGLTDRRNNLPSQLSGGQQQRVSIARALAKHPRLLLCDEPTGALVYETGKQILSELEALVREQGKTVVIVTHTQEIGKMAHRVMRMRSGQIVDVQSNSMRLTAKEIEW